MSAPYYADEWVTLYHGDCLEVMPLLGRGASAVLTDPPYGLSGSSGTINVGRAKSVYAGAWADDLDAVRCVFVPAVTMALALCGGRGAVTPGTPHCFEYPKPTDIAAILQPRTAGMSKWGRATWQPVLLYGRDPRVGLTIQPLTFTSVGPRARVKHPCPKAEDVAGWLVNRITLAGESILDPFAGSGTFLRAAKDARRAAIGIEIEERFCEIAADRCAQDCLDLGGAA